MTKEQMNGENKEQEKVENTEQQDTEQQDTGKETEGQQNTEQETEEQATTENTGLNIGGLVSKVAEGLHVMKEELAKEFEKFENGEYSEEDEGKVYERVAKKIEELGLGKTDFTTADLAKILPGDFEESLKQMKESFEQFLGIEEDDVEEGGFGGDLTLEKYREHHLFAQIQNGLMAKENILIIGEGKVGKTTLAKDLIKSIVGTEGEYGIVIADAIDNSDVLGEIAHLIVQGYQVVGVMEEATIGSAIDKLQEYTGGEYHNFFDIIVQMDYVGENKERKIVSVMYP